MKRHLAFCFVARIKGREQFAYEGRETGMGKALALTSSIFEAKTFGSTDEIMGWLGGHSRGFEAVEVECAFTEKLTHDLPDPHEYFKGR